MFPQYEQYVSMGYEQYIFISVEQYISMNRKQCIVISGVQYIFATLLQTFISFGHAKEAIASKDKSKNLGKIVIILKLP